MITCRVTNQAGDSVVVEVDQKQAYLAYDLAGQGLKYPHFSECKFEWGDTVSIELGGAFTPTVDELAGSIRAMLAVLTPKALQTLPSIAQFVDRVDRSVILQCDHSSTPGACETISASLHAPQIALDALSTLRALQLELESIFDRHSAGDAIRGLFESGSCASDTAQEPSSSIPPASVGNASDSDGSSSKTGAKYSKNIPDAEPTVRDTERPMSEEPILCYFAHPFGGDPEMLDRAERIVALLLEHCFGVLVWAPWIPMCRYWVDNGEARARGLAIDLAAIRRSDCLLVVNRGESPGCAAEVAEAERGGVPVVSVLVSDDLVAWINDVWVSWADVGERIREEVH